MDSSIHVDNLPAGVYRTSLGGEFLYANTALATLLGYASAKDLKEVPVRSLYLDEAIRDSWIQQFEVSNDDVVTTEFTWNRLGGGRLRVIDSARAIREGGVVVAFEGVIQKWSADSVQYSQEKDEIDEHIFIGSGEMRDRLLDFLPVCVIRKNQDRRFTFVNNNFCDVEGVSREDVLRNKCSDKLMWNEAIDEKYRVDDERVLKSGCPIIKSESHKYCNNRSRDVHVMKLPLFDSRKQEVVGLEVYYWDFETLAYRNFDREQSRRIERLFNTPGATAVYEHDFDGVFSYLSPAALKLLQLPAKPDGYRIQDVIAPEDLSIAKSHLNEKKKSDESKGDTLTTYKISILTATGQRVRVEVNSRTVFREEKRFKVIGYVRDISEEEEEIKERLQEVNHRVKNNLQTIITLLNREIREIPSDSEGSRSILLDCKSRIHAIADLHEELYKTNRTNKVEAFESLNRLIDSVAQTYRRPRQDIDVRKSIENSIVLSMDAMVPLVLIVQEIISNAFKHAFPEKENDASGKAKGFVFVSFGSIRNTSNRFYLTVHDTGVGLPQGFQLDTSRSLGMKLIKTLVERQLKGKVELFARQGTSFNIEFSDPSPVVHTERIHK